jgi:hypothetical protein
MAELSIASQIVRRQFHHADALGGFLHDVPNRLYRHPISSCPSHFVGSAKQLSSINYGCSEPIVQFVSHPIRNWNRSDVASLADQINNGSMLFTLLEVIQSQRHRFMPPQAAREQQCEQRSVAFSRLVRSRLRLWRARGLAGAGQILWWCVFFVSTVSAS